MEFIIEIKCEKHVEGDKELYYSYNMCTQALTKEDARKVADMFIDAEGIREQIKDITIEALETIKH